MSHLLSLLSILATSHLHFSSDLSVYLQLVSILHPTLLQHKSTSQSDSRFSNLESRICLSILTNQNNQSNQPSTQLTMCLFSSPKKHHRRSYVEEVYVAPRPVSRHSHHSHHHHGHGGHGRSSYTSVTRTSRPVSREYITPRMSQSSYRRSVPVVVEQRHSTRSYR